jgi:hypothetical protein
MHMFIQVSYSSCLSCTAFLALLLPTLSVLWRTMCRQRLDSSFSSEYLVVILNYLKLRTGYHHCLGFRWNREFDRVRSWAVPTLGWFWLSSANHCGVAAATLSTHLQPFPLLGHCRVQFGLQKHPTACQRVHLQSRITWNYLSSCHVLW